MVKKIRKILDMAMDNRILQLEQQVAKLKRENETSRKENEAMRKVLNKRDLNLIRISNEEENNQRLAGGGKERVC